MDELRYGLLNTAPFPNDQHFDFVEPVAKLEDQSTATFFHRFLTKLIDKNDYPVEKK
jgi:hypothetical protein